MYNYSDKSNKVSSWTNLDMESHNALSGASTLSSVQGVSRLVDITAGDDFLGLCDQKVHINMCPILDGYDVMDIF